MMTGIKVPQPRTEGALFPREGYLWCRHPKVAPRILRPWAYYLISFPIYDDMLGSVHPEPRDGTSEFPIQK
jgi:hypothetical protein